MPESFEEILNKQGTLVFTPRGNSMQPLLLDGENPVVLEKVSGRLQKGDIPFYKRENGQYVLHRIIDVRDGYYVIRGDNTFVKELVPDEWIIGVMTEFYRGKRHVLADNKAYRRYAAFWHAIYPLRKPFHLAHRFASKVKRKLFSKRTK